MFSVLLKYHVSVRAIMYVFGECFGSAIFLLNLSVDVLDKVSCY